MRRRASTAAHVGNEKTGGNDTAPSSVYAREVGRVCSAGRFAERGRATRVNANLHADPARVSMRTAGH
ncbi:MAG: hypothetical protein ABI556_03105, partial [Gemmatimonadales bacterium]